MNADARLKLGIALLVLGLVMPFGTLLVAATDWPIAVKTVGDPGRRRPDRRLQDLADHGARNPGRDAPA